MSPGRQLSGAGGTETILRVVAILVDEAIWPWRDRLWAHLVSDSSHEELHAFAARLGLPRRIFQGDHYDVPAELLGELDVRPVGRVTDILAEALEPALEPASAPASAAAA